MNQAIITASVPLPAKLFVGNIVSKNLPDNNGYEQETYKNPVLTPQLDTGVLFIISGVQKLNMIATTFEDARAHPAV
jgi:hypothetical protein